MRFLLLALLASCERDLVIQITEVEVPYLDAGFPSDPCDAGAYSWECTPKGLCIDVPGCKACMCCSTNIRRTAFGAFCGHIDAEACERYSESWQEHCQ